jgi:neutrophil factor 2
MSLKAELETWASALKAYDDEDFDKSLEQFSVCAAPVSRLPSLTVYAQRIADSSKIMTNMGLIYATLGEHEAAVEQFIAATGLDQYLAVAYAPVFPQYLCASFDTSCSSYFQCGVSNFLLGRYDLASKDFEGALLYLRGNQSMYVLRHLCLLRSS